MHQIIAGQNHAAQAAFSDEKLYELCQHYGHQARLWRQKFAGLLPEVNRRRLYEKKGFTSIFHFAKVLAGMSQEQVERVLYVEKKFENTPLLKNLLENGEVSINKLARITAVATQENQEFWVEQVKILSQSALETLVRDEKNILAATSDSECENGLFEPSKLLRNHENDSLPVRAHGAENKNKILQGVAREGEQEKVDGSQTAFANIAQLLQLKITKNIVDQLLELQQKGIDPNELFAEFLQKRKEEIGREKEELAHDTPQGGAGNISRHIPAEIRRLLQKEHGKKCSVPSCSRDAETIHHTQRWALTRTHDPHFLAPLCRNHHVIAHSIDMKFQGKRAEALFAQKGECVT